MAGRECARRGRERRGRRQGRRESVRGGGGRGEGSGEGGARDGSEGGGGATLSEATEDLTKASGSSAALAIMRTEAARRGCDRGTRALTASEEAEATERSRTRDIMPKVVAKASEVACTGLNEKAALCPPLPSKFDGCP